MLYNLLSVYTDFQVDISKHLQTLPICDKNNRGLKESVCTCECQILRIHIIYEAMSEEKRIWPIFG